MTFPINATGFRWRSLTPDQESSIRAAVRRGGVVKELALAYGVTPRTIYRAVIRADQPTYSVYCAGYQATFRLEEGGPIQATPWVPVERPLNVRLRGSQRPSAPLR